MGDVEIDMIGAEAAQALLDLMGDAISAEIAMNRQSVLVEEVIALAGMPVEPALGGDDHLVTTSADRLADNFLTATKAIGGRGVNQRYAGIDRGLDRGNRGILVSATPHPAADRPGAEADAGGLYPRSADVANKLGHGLFPSASSRT